MLVHIRNSTSGGQEHNGVYGVWCIAIMPLCIVQVRVLRVSPQCYLCFLFALISKQVRKTSQAALLMLLEQELIERADIENLVCPVLVDLTAPDSNDDVKTEAMAVSFSTDNLTF